MSFQQLALIALIVLPALHLLRAYRKYLKLSAIPTVGSSSFLSSYLAAVRFVTRGQDTIQQGCDKYYGRIFKVAEPTDWLLVVTGEKLIDEVRRMPEETLSMKDAIEDFLHATHTMGKQVVDNQYHVSVVRGPLTRNMVARFDDIYEEAVLALPDLISPSKEGITIPIRDMTLQLVGRTSNRYFLGTKLCRDPRYIAFCIKAVTNIFTDGFAINAFPPLLHPIVGPWLSKLTNNIKEATSFLGVLVQERLDMEVKDRPNDLITWHLEEANDAERTVPMLITRIMVINAVSLHTTSQSLSFPLLALGEHPECIASLREEVLSVTSTDGWTKNTMSKLVKVDSFIKEASRFYSGSIVHRCKSRKEFTMSDGTIVPPGSTLGLAQRPTHYDNVHYTDPHEFQPMRFCSGTDGITAPVHGKQMVNPTSQFLSFGVGRHACPGRFFAVNEIKLLFALIILNYDVELPKLREPEPVGVFVLTLMVPNEKASLVFKSRKAASGV